MWNLLLLLLIIIIINNSNNNSFSKNMDVAGLLFFLPKFLFSQIFKGLAPLVVQFSVLMSPPQRRYSITSHYCVFHSLYLSYCFHMYLLLGLFLFHFPWNVNFLRKWPYLLCLMFSLWKPRTVLQEINACWVSERMLPFNLYNNPVG